jgi:hypothetical protein
MARSGAGPAPTLRRPAGCPPLMPRPPPSCPRADAEATGKLPSAAVTGAAAGAAAVGGAAAAKFAGGRSASESDTARMSAIRDEPYGPGSARVAAGAAAPSGYTIKATRIRCSTTRRIARPTYDASVAELWFRDAESADWAGFSRWDAGGGASGAGAVAAGSAAAGGAGGAAAATFASTTGEPEAEPYGPGSVRVVAAGSAAPSGYTIKGNEDSMLYHTPDSPSYEQTIAEVWFRDEESAVKAGFMPWHKGEK